MCLFVTGVSMLIHLYSMATCTRTGILEVLIYLNAFVFSMVLLVLANNLLVTSSGGRVGVCSYWLVAFCSTATRPPRQTEGLHVQPDRRCGFLLAMFLIFSKVGSLNYLTIFSHTTCSAPPRHRCGAAAGPAATGKSAQIPCSTGCPTHGGPDAVSALIHAATMVTAGSTCSAA